MGWRDMPDMHELPGALAPLEHDAESTRPSPTSPLNIYRPLTNSLHLISSISHQEFQLEVSSALTQEGLLVPKHLHIPVLTYIID